MTILAAKRTSDNTDEYLLKILSALDEAQRYVQRHHQNATNAFGVPVDAGPEHPCTR